MTATVQGDRIVITDPGAAISGRELKQMGARWDGDLGAWTLLAARMYAQMLFDAAPALGDLRVALTPPEGKLDDARLYDYQRRAAHRLATAPHGQILVAAPGLGKTAIAVAAADKAAPDDQVVVIAPASLLRTWEREIRKWQTVPGGVYIMESEVDYEAAASARWIIASWDKMSRDADVWGKGWRLWILDESVMAKSRRSQRALALLGGTVRKRGEVVRRFPGIRRGVERVWLLSGSPTTRYDDDLWAQLRIVWPKAFPSYWRFAERYTVVEQTPWARVVSGPRAGRNAAEDNADLVLVISEEDAGLDLPDYLFEPCVEVVLQGAQKREYDRMAREFLAELGDGTQVIAKNEVARLMKLQQIASWWDGQSAKHDALLDLIPSYEPPFLIWTHWKEGASALTERLVNAGVGAVHVDGDTRDKDGLIEAYKAGKHDALVLSLGVGKFGHTLVNTRTVAYVDRSWNADDYYQSLHRVKRIGLKHRPVVLPFRAAGTIDLLVEDNLEGKMGGISRMTRADLRALLEGLGR